MSEQEWLKIVNELQKIKPLYYYVNKKYGPPRAKILELYKRNMSPQEALEYWKQYGLSQ